MPPPPLGNESNKNGNKENNEKSYKLNNNF